MIDDQKKKVQFKTQLHNTIQENKFVGKQEQMNVITTSVINSCFLKVKFILMLQVFNVLDDNIKRSIGTCKTILNESKD